MQSCWKTTRLNCHQVPSNTSTSQTPISLTLRLCLQV